MGARVKMITGDQTAIAKETSRLVGLGTNILGTEFLQEGVQLVTNCEVADGFAEVMPEHK